jgi:hypothetical protein
MDSHPMTSVIKVARINISGLTEILLANPSSQYLDPKNATG